MQDQHPSPQKRARRLCLSLALGILGLALLPVGASAALTFAPEADFPAGDGQLSVAVGDFNRDGRADLVKANASTDDVSVLLGAGSGSLGRATSFPAGDTPRSVAVGDLNGDGNLDLVTADGGGGVSVLLGSGNGSFGAPTSYEAGAAPRSVAIGDFNNDGKPDLATANQGSEDASVLLGTGSGSFGAATGFSVGEILNPGDLSPFSVAIGDLNNDGRPDLAVANSFAGNVAILLGAGDGSFGPPTSFPAGSFPFSVAIGDLNNDGRPDLVTANDGSSDVNVLLGKGNGSFDPRTPFDFDNPFPLRSVVIGDLNGDGVPDLAAGGQLVGSADGFIRVLPGEGDGSFGAAITPPSGHRAGVVAIGDLNGDGAPDLATAHDGGVSVLLNAPTADANLADLAFGSPTPVPRGTLSAPQSVQLTNNGSAPLVVSGFAFTGVNPDDFTTGADTCHAPIAPDRSCSVQVRFAPHRKGERAATLTALTNAASNPTVALSGTAGPLPSGPRGPRGPRGPAGRDAQVVCLVKNQGVDRVKVVCEVKIVDRRPARLRWRLTRHRRTVAHGVLNARNGHARLKLSEVERLQQGRYVLHIAGRRHGTAFVVR